MSALVLGMIADRPQRSSVRALLFVLLGELLASNHNLRENQSQYPKTQQF